jgi:hypothetical protein
MSAAPTPLLTALLIDGELVQGQGFVEPILNPATGEVLTQIAEASIEQVEAAILAAHRAFAGWSRTTPQQRSNILLGIADAIEHQADYLARLESLNCGKPLHLARQDDLSATVDVFRFFAGAVRCQTGQLSGEYLPGYTSMVRRDPIGVVASIAPWNYPLMMAAWKIAPALAAGNTLVFKPSEHTPLSILALAPALNQLLPRGVINIVCGGGEGVGSHLVSHPKVRMVSLTGDIVTGQKILQAASKTLKRTHLELGWQGAGDRMQRRRPASRGRRRARLRLLQRRPGLHRRVPHLRPGGDSRQIGRRPGRGGQQPALCRQARCRQRTRPADQHAPARPRRQLCRTRSRPAAYRTRHRRRRAFRRGLLLSADLARRL